jgi:hypothetical protein
MPPPFSLGPAAPAAAPVKHVAQAAGVGAEAEPVRLVIAVSPAFARSAVVRVSRVAQGPASLFAKPDFPAAAMQIMQRLSADN